MVKIVSIDENYEWMSLVNKIIVSPEYKVNWLANDSNLYEHIKSVKPQIVFLPSSSSYDVYRLCTKISKEFPMTSILLVFQSEEELDMKGALRAGADDVIFLTSPISKIKEDINLAIVQCVSKMFQQQQLIPAKNAKVITVCSTKGGIGKTTIAVNLAVAYGRKFEKVAVVDLDLQFGDVAMFLDVKPKLTIYDWVKEDKDGNQIEDYMTHFKDGISILAGPQRPEFAEVITGEDVRKAIVKLRQQYDVVIIDASSHMNEIAIIALENSDDILLMTYLDLPTLKNSKILLDTLESLHLGDRVRVVLNRYMKVKGVTTNTVEAVIGMDVFSVLPVMDRAMITAVNEGQPLSYSNPRSQVAKRIFKLAEALYNFNGQPALNKKDRPIELAGGYV